MTSWVDGLKKQYKGKIAYAIGFTPPPTATGGTTAATTSN
jgi:hypothetical protein